jgi:hypothetical protein
MRLYHVTHRASAQAILEDGFRDAEVIHDNRELQSERPRRGQSLETP